LTPLETSAYSTPQSWSLQRNGDLQTKLYCPGGVVMTAAVLGMLIALHGFAGQATFSSGTFSGAMSGATAPSANLASTESEVCGSLPSYDSTSAEAVGAGFDCYFTPLAATGNPD